MTIQGFWLLNSWRHLEWRSISPLRILGSHGLIGASGVSLFNECPNLLKVNSKILILRLLSLKLPSSQKSELSNRGLLLYWYSEIIREFYLRARCFLLLSRGRGRLLLRLKFELFLCFLGICVIILGPEWLRSQTLILIFKALRLYYYERGGLHIYLRRRFDSRLYSTHKTNLLISFVEIQGYFIWYVLVLSRIIESFTVLEFFFI